ncbi:unnamed protein product, partial [Mesorhabditis belari]|uniref:MSP domain-containing protein n=1 Tax=Mesorhabditis belari TaxID=2138241 RepID=A0AAF3FPT7_9BILA
MALNIEPPTGIFPAAGGEITFQIHSLADTRLAFKVKSSDNDHYRVRPVYGFLAAKQQQSLQILRLEGSPKEDKFVVQWAEVPDEETDPQAPFKAGAQSGEVILPVKAE